MNEHIFYIISMAISGGIFMTISIRNSWSLLLWEKINKKVKSSWNVVLWLCGSVAFQLSVQLIAEMFTDKPLIIKSLAGFAMGVSLSLMPSPNNR